MTNDKPTPTVRPVIAVLERARTEQERRMRRLLEEGARLTRELAENEEGLYDLGVTLDDIADTIKTLEAESA